MSGKTIRSVFVGAAVLVAIGLAAPAYAQLGSIKGRVVGPDGKPVAEVSVVIDLPADPTTPAKQILTDGRGEFDMTGLRFGQWRVLASKGDLVGSPKDLVTVQANNVADIGDLPMHKSAPSEKTVSPEERAKMEEELKKVKADIDAANAAMTAGNYDDALTRLQSIITKVEKCVSCYTNMGTAYSKKGDDQNAEVNFKKAIDLDPESKDAAGAYAGMAAIYNKRQNFTDAAKMSAKANDLLEAGGGAGNASTAYQQGIIFWNAGDKMAEAEAQFRKAVKLDPKMAEAQYYLGMTLVNQGKMADAKAPFTEYLKLDPKGKYAQDVKDILAAIK